MIKDVANEKDIYNWVPLGWQDHTIIQDCKEVRFQIVTRSREIGISEV